MKPKFFNKFKKTYFWPIFPFFWGKKLCRKYEKIDDPIPRKHTDRMKGVGVGGLNPIWQDPSSTAGEGGGDPWQSCKPHHFSLRIILTFHIFPNTSSILTQHVAPIWCRENKLGNNTSHIASYHGMHKAWREMKQCFKCYAFAKMLSLLICTNCIEQVFCQQWICKIILISSLILLHLFEDIKWKW